jgi:hypothetical protein
MPEDIEKIVDEAFEEMDTLEMPAVEPEVWTLIGFDAEDEDPTELDLVIEALESATPTPWYDKLNRELSK